jgi:tetratricopeptide (TPR) repeat protein
MAVSAKEARRLVGKVIAFAGKLACMTRGEAASLVRARGGAVTPTVNSRTGMVVVGQEGWPLRKNGRLSPNLVRARKLQEKGRAIAVLSEEEFLRYVGLDAAEDVRRHYTASRLAELLNVSRDQLRSWLRKELIHPTQSVDGLDYFDYAQVVGVKTLADLTSAGVKLNDIRRSLLQLRRWLPDVADPLRQLTILEQAGEVRVRYNDQLVEPTGQKVFDFDDDVSAPSLTVHAAEPQDWFELACEHEEAGRLAEAADAYRQALLVNGVDRDTSFNLANVLYALNHKAQALERYYQVLELDKSFARARVNIGVILYEFRHYAEARLTFETALQMEPDNLEARYNLADLLQSTGRWREAEDHWREYFRRDPQSQWGRYARRQLRHG